MSEASNDEDKPGRWYPGMPSPNPKGRPPGIRDRRAKLNHMLLKDADAILQRVVESALDGDTTSAALVLNRVLPALKAQAERVSFDFDVNAPLAQQVEAVLVAIAGGDVPADMGKSIIESISALAGIKQIDELEQRLNALEGKL
jgi:hypothetical protein